MSRSIFIRRNILGMIKDILLNMLFPPRCPVCDEIVGIGEKYIHAGCASSLYEIGNDVCLRCGKPVASASEEYCDDCRRAVATAGRYKKLLYKQGKALFVYKGDIKHTMYRFKYSNRREYAAYFSQKTVDKYLEWIQSCGIDVIVPVPMYGRKKKKRGYNQAESFAKELSRRTKIPVNIGLVKRVKDTQPLKTMGYIQRKNCLERAFQVDDSIVKYYHILLVDDIYTTGSTAEAICSEIMKHSACDIYLMNICIGQEV